TPAHSASRSMKLRWLLLQFLAAPLTAQVAPRPFQATDYYRLTFVGEPRLAPDARRVAFTVTTVVEDKDRRHSEIWIAATDGSAPDRLKQQAWRSSVSPLAITRGPDVKRFDGRVYTSLPLVEDERGLVAPRETRRPRHLYLVPLAGGEPRQLTDGDLSQIDAAWSPDGRAVAFVQDSTETQEVRAQVRPQLYVLAIADGTI